MINRVGIGPFIQSNKFNGQVVADHGISRYTARRVKYTDNYCGSRGSIPQSDSEHKRPSCNSIYASEMKAVLWNVLSSIM